ncbi:MAG: hypothetical protein NTU44_16520 [Bacteroidetes bacterium]|nr:hypothetical protein [Bacteroidota bacterium]
MTRLNINGKYLGNRGKGYDSQTGQPINQYNSDGTITPIPSTLPTTEIKADDPYSNSRVLCGDDKGMGPWTGPANGSIEIGVSGAAIFGGGISLGLAWDSKGGGSLQLNIDQSGGFEPPSIGLTFNTFTPTDKSFSVKDLAGSSNKTSGGAFMFNYGAGSNVDLRRGLSGNLYKERSYGISTGMKSIFPASGKQTRSTTFQLTW